jgi:hypothetical protein
MAAESRIAQSYVQLVPLLSKDFAKDLQKAINSALKGVNFAALSDGLREEGRRAGRDFRRGLDAGVGNDGVDLNLRETIQEAGQAGRRSGHDFRQALDSAVGSDGIPIGTNETIQEAGADGKKAGKNYTDSFQNAVTGAPPVTPPGSTPAQAAAQGAAAGQSFAQNFNQTVAGQLDGLKDKIAGIFATGGVVAAAKFGLDKAMEYDAGTREITASLAISDDATKEKVAEAVKAILRSGTVEDWAGAEMAVESVLASDPKLLEAPLEDIVAIARRAAELEKAFEIDLPQAVAVSGQMVKQGFVKDTKEGLSLLLVSMQKMSIATRAEIIENMNEYSKHFQGMGFSAKAAFGMMISAAQEGGSMGLDQTADSLKEAGILLTDTTNTTTTEALAKIGLKHSDIAADIIAGGDKADAALEKVALALLGVEDQTQRLALAKAVLGTPLEELGFSKMNEVLKDIATANDSLGDTEAAAQKLSDEMNDTLSASLLKLQNEALITFSEVFAPLLEQLVPILTEILVWMQENKEMIKEWIPPIMIIVGALGLLLSLGVFTLLASAAAAFIGPLLIIAGVLATIGALGMAIWKWVDQWPEISKNLDVIGSRIEAWRMDMIHGIDDFVNAVTNNIGTAFENLAIWLDNVRIMAVNSWVDSINQFTDFISGGTAQKLTGESPREYKEYQKVPGMATGGDVTGPTLLMAGEDDPETIVNRGVMNKALGAITSRINEDEKSRQRGNTKIIINQLPGMSQQELADLVVDRLAWES